MIVSKSEESQTDILPLAITLAVEWAQQVIQRISSEEVDCKGRQKDLGINYLQAES